MDASAGSWGEEQVNQLLQAVGTADSGDVSYEKVIGWIMAPAPVLHTTDLVCQAAFDGDLEKLRKVLASDGSATISGATGFVQAHSTVVGMWTMIPNTFQLQAPSECPSIRPAHALQWAAFCGKADVVRFLMDECGMDKDDEGSFGWTPLALVSSHRLGLDGAMVTDEGDVSALLEDDDLPLCASALEKALAQSCTPAAKSAPEATMAGGLAEAVAKEAAAAPPAESPAPAAAKA